MVSRPADVNAYDATGETMPPAARSSHLCWLPSRGVTNSMVITPSGASFLCQHPLGTTTRSPARRLRSVALRFAHRQTCRTSENVEQLVARSCAAPKEDCP